MPLDATAINDGTISNPPSHPDARAAEDIGDRLVQRLHQICIFTIAFSKSILHMIQRSEIRRLNLRSINNCIRDI